MNRINKLFGQKQEQVLSVYFTAGFPERDSTQQVIRALAAAGTDMIEIGIPFSDPMADGPVIQHSNHTALKNGMSLRLLLQQVKEVRKDVTVPLLLMGYLNPVLQYGMERFCHDAKEAGVDGVIFPDLSPEIYQAQYESSFAANGLKNIFLVTQQTSPERIALIDQLTDAFIYLVTSAATTGGQLVFTEAHKRYFNEMKQMQLKNPLLGGFGISDAAGFATVCEHLHGAVIGSSFIRALQKGNKDISTIILHFIKQLRP